MGLVTNNNQTLPPVIINIPVGIHDLHHLPKYDPQTPCSSCGLKSSGIMFECKTVNCSYTYLHRACAEFQQALGRLPKSFTHSSHITCPLSISDYSRSGSFVCNGCSKPGNRWSYQCGRCRYNLHIDCVIKPLKIRQQSHASCELHLSFAGPYPMVSTIFLCNVCNKPGANQWRYRCSTCDFDIHMDCVNIPPQMIRP